jgi:hypothetical protein
MCPADKLPTDHKTGVNGIIPYSVVFLVAPFALGFVSLDA